MHIHLHQVEGRSFTLAHLLERFLTIERQADPVAEPLHQHLHVLAVDRMIVGHQHLQRARAGVRPRGERSRIDPGAADDRRRRLGHRRLQPQQRQQHAEGAALPGLAVDPDVTAHHAHQLARDLQAKTGAAEAPADAVVALAEALEQPAQRGGIHADAGVDDAQPRQCHAARCGGWQRVDQQPHLAPVGELDRVANQIEDHLLEPLAVDLDPLVQRRIEHRLELQPLGPRLRSHQGLDLGQQARQVDRMGRQLEPARLQLGQVQHIVEDGQQVLAGLARDLQMLALLRIERGAVEQRHHAQQAVEGRAQLVAHVGQEGALGPVGLLGLGLGLLQPGGELLQRLAAALERTHLPHDDAGEQQDQQALEQGQRDADAVLLAHALVAADDARAHRLVRQQRQIAHRRRQRLVVGDHRLQRGRVQRLGRLRAQHGIDPLDHAVQQAHHPVMLGQVGHDLAGALRIDQADAADEDVVALAKIRLGQIALRRRQGGAVAREVAQLLAQAQVFGLELEEAPDDVVALIDDIGAEQAQRLRLQPGDAAEDQRQQQRHDRQQAADSPRSGRGSHRGGRPAHSTSITFSCQAERL